MKYKKHECELPALDKKKNNKKCGLYEFDRSQFRKRKPQASINGT